MEMHHFSHHDHPLMFTEEQKYDVDKSVWCCDGCDLPISPDKPSYSCSRHGCEFKLHKVCAELPRDIKEHPLHPNHPLILLPKPSDDDDVAYFAYCCACHSWWEKFTYHCESCYFDLDPFCALPSIMGVHHFSHHEHPLMFIEEQKYDVNGRVWCCDGCDLPISVGNPSYSCSRHNCEFKLHKVCSELPTEIKEHPLHPNHTFTFFPNSIKGSVCDSCYRKCEKFSYICESCNFILDIFCALPSIMGQLLQFKHPSHHHPLTFLSVEALFLCSGCNTKHSEGQSYLCTTCNKFWIHRDCALLPASIKHPDLHDDHPLVLAFSIPKKYSTFWIICDICRSAKSFLDSKWWYYCGECCYYAHVKCAIWNRQSLDRGEKTGYGWKTKDIDESELIRLPVTDESSWITNNFPKKTIIEGTKTTKHDDDKVINHFSHPDHPLILFKNPKNEESSSELMYHKKNTTIASPSTSTSTSGGRKFCNGCLQTISKSIPYYGCIPCDFFLHQDCTFLPNELLQHPLHPEHPLVLLPKAPHFFGVFKCYCCQIWCNGFTYGCNTCKYYLDLRCASLPTAITHEAHFPNHPHFLVLSASEDLQYVCQACLDKVKNPYKYKCKSCNFEIGVSCAQLPHTIEHRYDKHPFVLTYRPLKDHPEDYFCEICEEELNPQWWFYHCIECDQSIHLFCYFDRSENLKYGGTINVNCHPHPIAFAKLEWDSNCDSCNESIHTSRDFDIFECLRCVKYKMHWECAESCVL